MSKAGLLLDGLLIRVARGRSCLDLCIGERLLVLRQRSLAIHLGYSSVADYALEILGLGRRTAHGLVRLAERLAGLPVLREAVEAGLVSARKAELVLGVVTPETEQQWVELARGNTVRRLAGLVRAERERGEQGRGEQGREEQGREEQGREEQGREEQGREEQGREEQGRAPADVEEEPTPAGDRATPALLAGSVGNSEDEDGEAAPWVSVELPVTSEAGAAWQRAVEQARRICGPAASGAELVEAICGEYLSHALPLLSPADLACVERMLEQEEPDSTEAERRRCQAALRDELQAALEQMTADWGFLPREGFRVTRPAWAQEIPGDAHAVHQQLLRLIGLRRRLEEWLGRLARLMRQIGAWRAARFASFSHYGVERLGLAPRTLAAHLELDRVLLHHPDLLPLYRDGKLSGEKLRRIARLRLDSRAMAAWAAFASRVTCRLLDVEVARALDVLAEHPDASPLPPALPEVAARGCLALAPSSALSMADRSGMTWGAEGNHGEHGEHGDPMETDSASALSQRPLSAQPMCVDVFPSSTALQTCASPGEAAPSAGCMANIPLPAELPMCASPGEAVRPGLYATDAPSPSGLQMCAKPELEPEPVQPGCPTSPVGLVDGADLAASAASAPREVMATGARPAARPGLTPLEDLAGGSDPAARPGPAPPVVLAAGASPAASPGPAPGSFPAPPVRVVRFRAPVEVRSLFFATLEAARRLAGDGPGTGRGAEPTAWQSRAVLRVATHFCKVWGQREPGTGEPTLAQQVVERDGCRCAVPGCSSRLRLQSHHVHFRGRGGPDTASNQTSLCLIHHLEGIHRHRVQVEGEAPGGLTWALGTEPGRLPVACYRGEVLLAAR